MNYYPLHIGDYASHTAHLEPMEDLAYRRLLDVYYTREAPLPADIQATAKLVRMRSMSADVESVLREFFTLTAEGWTNKRADAEIQVMREKQDKQREKANKRWEYQRQARGIATASHDDAAASKPDAVAMPPTPTPTPTPTPKVRNTARERAPDCPDGVASQVWADWLALRKAKRAPVTSTVLEGAAQEAATAGLSLEDFLRVWCRRGTQGLEASWLKPHERGSPGPPAESTWQREAREQVERMTGGLVSVKPPKPQLEIIDGCTRESRFSALG